MKITIYFLLLSIFLISFSQKTNAQFVPAGSMSGGNVYCLQVYNSNVYAGTASGGVYMSSNNGASWNQLGLSSEVINSLLIINNYIFAGTNTGVFRTSNNGANWVQLNYGTSGMVTALTNNGTDIYLGTNAAIYKSSNYGTSWSLFSNYFGSQIYAILIYNNIFYAGGAAISSSTDNGATWHIENVGPGWVKSFYVLNNVIRAGTTSGGFKNTTPLGGWIRELPWGNYILGYGSAGNYILMGSSVGIFWSSDNGTSWHDPTYDFLYGTYVWSMAQTGSYIFAGTGSAVFRRPASELIGISKISSDAPGSFSLHQNYPNPFNPSTTIKFDISRESNVLLEISNELGQVVSTPINRKLEAGTYRYSLDGTSLTGGIYFYKLTAGSFFDVKKMILIK